MRLRRAMVWVMVIALSLGLTGVGWNLVFIERQQNQSQDQSTAIRSCDTLREFIVSEEDQSLKLWTRYHRKVIAYSKGLPRDERGAKVSEIAESVTLVLESDLRIYRQMKRLPQCLEPTFRGEVKAWISTTEEMIDYLRGRGKIDGERFDPSKGIWDTTFYDTFYSATDNLISGLIET